MTLDELVQAENTGTPGPWEYYEERTACGLSPNILEDTAYYPSAPDMEDMKLIRVARNILPEVIALVRAVELVCLEPDASMTWVHDGSGQALGKALAAFEKKLGEQ